MFSDLVSLLVRLLLIISLPSFVHEFFILQTAYKVVPSISAEITDLTAVTHSNTVKKAAAAFREGRIKTSCYQSSIRALSVGHYQSKKNERIKSPYRR